MHNLSNKIKALLCGAAAVMLMPSAAASAAGELVFSLPESASANADSIVIDVSVTENPGVQSWVMILGYDPDAAAFEGLNGGIFAGIDFNDDPAAGRVEVNCFSARDISDTGTAFSASFKPKNGAEECVFTLEPSDDKGNFFDRADNEIACRVSRGKLTVKLGGKKGSADDRSGTQTPSEEGSAPQPDTPQTVQQPAESSSSPESAAETPSAVDGSAASEDGAPAENKSDESSAPNTSHDQPTLVEGGANALPADSSEGEKNASDGADNPAESASDETGSPRTGGGGGTAVLTILAAAGAVAASKRKRSV